MSRRPEKTPRPLSPAQREIMEILWDRGELSAAQAAELLSHLSGPGRLP